MWNIYCASHILSNQKYCRRYSSDQNSMMERRRNSSSQTPVGELKIFLFHWCPSIRHSVQFYLVFGTDSAKKVYSFMAAFCMRNTYNTNTHWDLIHGISSPTEPHANNNNEYIVVTIYNCKLRFWMPKTIFFNAIRSRCKWKPTIGSTLSMSFTFIYCIYQAPCNMIF